MQPRELAFEYQNLLKTLKPLSLGWLFDKFKKPVTRIELVTSPLPRVCSTTEPHGRNMILLSQARS